jgi:hypothetical protein
MPNRILILGKGDTKDHNQLEKIKSKIFERINKYENFLQDSINNKKELDLLFDCN